MRAMRFAALALLALASFAAQAQLYRWTDAQGRTHVTDTPPPAGAKGAPASKGTAKRTRARKTTPAPSQQAAKFAPKARKRGAP